MAHVRWTPANVKLPDGISWATMNACEDRRIHKRLDEIGMGDNLTAPILDQDGWERFDRALAKSADPSDPACPMPPLEIARMIVASDLTAESRPFRRMVDAHGFGWVTALTDVIVTRNRLGARRPAWRRTLETAEDLERSFQEMTETSERSRELLPNYTGKPGSGKWGKMTIHEMPLVDPLPRSINTRKRYATDCGSVPQIGRAHV